MLNKKNRDPLGGLTGYQIDKLTADICHVAIVMNIVINMIMLFVFVLNLIYYRLYNTYTK